MITVFTVWGQKVSSKDFCVLVCKSHHRITVLLVTSDTLPLRISSLGNATNMRNGVRYRPKP